MPAHHLFTEKPNSGAGKLAWEYFLSIQCHFTEIRYGSHQWTAYDGMDMGPTIVSYELRHWDFQRRMAARGV